MNEMVDDRLKKLYEKYNGEFSFPERRGDENKEILYNFCRESYKAAKWYSDKTGNEAFLRDYEYIMKNFFEPKGEFDDYGGLKGHPLVDRRFKRSFGREEFEEYENYWFEIKKKYVVSEGKPTALSRKVMKLALELYPLDYLKEITHFFFLDSSKKGSDPTITSFRYALNRNLALKYEYWLTKRVVSTSEAREKVKELIIFSLDEEETEISKDEIFWAALIFRFIHQWISPVRLKADAYLNNEAQILSQGYKHIKLYVAWNGMEFDGKILFDNLMNGLSLMLAKCYSWYGAMFDTGY